ncbi:MAG TPA: hypothetical protein VIL46_11575 [Gemmataceae bacterium]
MSPEHEPEPAEPAPAGPGPRFDVVAYQPDGGCPVVGTAALFATTVLGGAIAGWLVNRLMGAIGICLCCASGPVQLALLGFAIGTVGSIAVVMGKVRAPHVAGMAGVIGMFASVLGQLFSEYQQFMDAARVNPAVLNVPPAQFTFFDYLGQLPLVELIPLGIGFIIGAGSSYPVMAGVAGRPFDPIADQWKQRFALARLRMRPSEAVRLVSRGEIVGFAVAEVNPERGDVELAAYVSPHGMPQATVEVEVEEVLKDAKQKHEQRHRLGMWTYPAEALPVLDYLFPGSIPAHAEKADAPDRLEDRLE